MAKNDELKVQKFNSSVRMTSMNVEAPKKLSKKNNKSYILGVLLIGAAIFVPIGSSAWYDHNHKQVEHAKDTYDDGILRHNHELTKKDFISDYKFVNPEAENNDIAEAIDNGELRDYKDGNKGYISVDKDLQNDTDKEAVEYYNEDCVEFADQYLSKEQAARK